MFTVSTFGKEKRFVSNSIFCTSGISKGFPFSTRFDIVTARRFIIIPDRIKIADMKIILWLLQYDIPIIPVLIIDGFHMGCPRAVPS